MRRPLQDLCALITDGTHYTPPDVGEGVPFLTVKDVSGEGLDFQGCSRISQTDFAAAQAGNSAPRRGDVLFSKDGTVGKVHVVATDRDFAVLSSLAILRPDPNEIDAGYLGHMLKTPDVIGQATRRTTGSAIRRIVLKDLRKVEIGVPPLDEQRRIAAILDKADALGAKRRQALAYLDDLVRSIFHDMFGRESWAVSKLGDLASTTSGGTPARGKAEYYGGDIPWVKSGELHSGLVLSTEESITELGLASSTARLVPPGTVLVAMYGATAGVVGQLGIEAATNQAVCAITPGPLLDDTYMIAILRSLTSTLLSRRAGGAQPNLSQGTIRSLEIPVPPIDLQREFAVRIERCTAQRDAVKRGARIDEELFGALQAHAFRGEL